jgi:hypothetical protein
MGWPESLTYLLLVVLGYALMRIVDLGIDWQRNRLQLRSSDGGELRLSGTARQRLMERRAAYADFRKSVNAAVNAAVNEGHGNYGLLYEIRDAYGELLHSAPAGVTQAADSVIRCVTLLVNLGPSDQRYAMLTRALKLFDEECDGDQGLKVPPPGPHHLEFSVLGGDVPASMGTRLPEPPATASVPREEEASRTESGSGSVRART